MRIALYEPDIPQNTGAILRLGACMGVAVDIIEPCGFALTDAKMRRAGMDYIGRLEWCCHRSWSAFLAAPPPGRVVLLTTGGAAALTAFPFAPTDTLLMGSESAGVPATVHDAVDARVAIPQAAGTRSLNVAMAAAIATHEALRQTGVLPLAAPPSGAGAAVGVKP